MRQDNKIVFTGPVGVGKTTAIRSLADGEIISTDAKASDMTINRKSNTTVALDYGIMSLPSGEKIHLYGTPGQERFDFMWDILTNGGLGLILMLDNTRPSPKRDLEFFLNAFKEYIKTVPVVIGVTKMDIQPKPNCEDYVTIFNEVIQNLNFKIFNPLPPIFELDGRNKEDIKKIVMALLFSIDPGISA